MTSVWRNLLVITDYYIDPWLLKFNLLFILDYNIYQRKELLMTYNGHVFLSSYLSKGLEPWLGNTKKILKKI